MPPVLQETLYVLDDLADESGYERILDELGRSGAELDVEVTDDDLTPGEFAIAVLQQRPQVIATCHARIDSRKVKNYREFQSPDHTRLALRRARRARRQLQTVLSPWFASRRRSAACEVYVYREDREIKFQITHGRPRSDMPPTIQTIPTWRRCSAAPTGVATPISAGVATAWAGLCTSFESPEIRARTL
jgi:hypothetical protein